MSAATRSSRICRKYKNTRNVRTNFQDVLKSEPYPATYQFSPMVQKPAMNH